jgi:hypothetical protein
VATPAAWTQLGLPIPAHGPAGTGTLFG